MSAAKWLLMVDWNGDERFAGAYDDVTGATLGVVADAYARFGERAHRGGETAAAAAKRRP